MTIRADLSGVLLDPTTNLALWLDRFAPEHTQEALRLHHQNALRGVAVPGGYKAAFRRRELALLGFAGGFEGGETLFYRAQLDGRAIIGIGEATVRETGCTLLRPWGVPCIPGSALKGLAARTAHRAGGEWARPELSGGDAGRLHPLIFGDVARAGAVVFHDAWWVPDSRIGVHTDTMTVHHANYYQGEGPPSDTDEPTPVSFLSVSGSYQVALSGPAEAVKVAEAILRRGLRESGVGAKTAAGYGRSTLDPQAPAPRPKTLEERLEEEHRERRRWSAKQQAKWLVEAGRRPAAGASEEEWRASLRESYPAGIAYLRGGGGSDDQELNSRLDEHVATKPKSKKGKEFKKWKKEHLRLEKEVEKAGRAADNREAQQAKADEFLSWLEMSD